MASFVRTYEQSRLSGQLHTDALRAVLKSYKGLSAEKQEMVWITFERRAANPESLLDRSAETVGEKRRRELGQLMFQMLYEFNGPWDHKTQIEITTSIFNAVLASRYKWD